MSPRVLMIGGYPIRRPTFGGPRRSRAIFDALSQRFPVAQYVAVHPRDDGDPGPDDIAVSSTVQRNIDRQPFLADVLAGDAIYSDVSTRKRVERHLREFKPDIVIVESLFPFLGLGPLLADLDSSARVVYSSENVEHRMKLPMYASFPFEPDVRAALLTRLTEAERELAVRSDLVVAVTTDDLKAFEMMGARRTVLAPHGAWALRPTERARVEHARWLAAHQIRQTAVFVSSAHQPNWQGFLEMVGTRLGFVPFGARIIIGGSVGDIASLPAEPVSENATFWLRAIRLGGLSEDRLGAIVLSANVVILPITTGGGSNLKTAEAIVSGRPIVATSYAFRGYEEFKDRPQVRIADDPDTYRAAIAEALRTATPAAHEAAVPRELSWQERLRPMIEEIARL